MDIIWNRRGVTREVILIGRYAFKLPKLTYGWRLFLQGLLSNMQEREWGRSSYPGICPVVWSIPGGWLVVMRRAQVLTAQEFAEFDARAFCNGEDMVIPAEAKQDSFGWLDGVIVAIDYG